MILIGILYLSYKPFSASIDTMENYEQSRQLFAEAFQQVPTKE